MNLTATQFNDLRNIASLAYGSGLLEGTNGGKGTMGLMRGPNGEPRVFKCLTHSAERDAFAQNDTGRYALDRACDELRLELTRLAAAAGMAEGEVDALFAEAPAGGLLSRKIVARVVSAIGKANGGENVWAGVKHAGTVANTSLNLDGDTLSLAHYGDKGFKAMEEAALAGGNYTLVTTGSAAADQIAAGYLGDEWKDALRMGVDFLGQALPKGLDPLAVDLLIAKPEGVPLARPTFVAAHGHDEQSLRPQLLQRELVRLLREHGDRELTADVRKQLVRAALTNAVTEAWVLKKMFDVAEAKGNISDTPALDLLNTVVWNDDGTLRDAAVQMIREGVRAAMDEQAREADERTSLYLRNIYLDEDSLDVMAANAFDPNDDDGIRTQNHARKGLNAALSFAWSSLTRELKAVFAETHDKWEGDPEAYKVPTGQGIYNAPGKLYMTEFYLDD